jgi:hypothetical protein
MPGPDRPVRASSHSGASSSRQAEETSHSRRNGGMLVPVLLIVPPDEIALAEVAKIKPGWRPDWRGALEEPAAIWDGEALSETLKLIERLPQSEVMRCFTPGYGIRLHDAAVARAEVLFCFHCHRALMIDLANPRHKGVGATFDPDSDPAQELLSRFRGCKG